MSISSIGGFGNFDVSALQQRAQSRFEQLDTNGNGSVELEEAKSSGKNSELVEKAFAKFDLNGDGSISADERQGAVEKISDKVSQLGFGSQFELSQLLFQSSEENQSSSANADSRSALDAYRRFLG